MPNKAMPWQADGAAKVLRGTFVLQRMRQDRPRSARFGFRVTHFWHGGTQHLISHILPDAQAASEWMNTREATGGKGGDVHANQRAAEQYAAEKGGINEQ